MAPPSVTACDCPESRLGMTRRAAAATVVLVRLDPRMAGALIHEAGLVIVGERHGTNEFPALVSLLAAAGARHGSLIVAVELADDARQPLADYLGSAGTAGDRKHMLSTPSWQRQDGRASLAMLRLVEQLRRLGTDGASIEIDVIDVETPGAEGVGSFQNAREQALAERVFAIRERGTTLVLTGNIHAEFVARPDAPDDFVPAAARIARHTGLLSFVGCHAGGASWCTLPVDGRLVTAAHPVDGVDLGTEPFVETQQSSRAHHGIAYVGRLTPSPPAVTS